MGPPAMDGPYAHAHQWPLCVPHAHRPWTVRAPVLAPNADFCFSTPCLGRYLRRASAYPHTAATLVHRRCLSSEVNVRPRLQVTTCCS